jgi:HTH-type transcriptional regulator/antitoxin HigA
MGALRNVDPRRYGRLLARVLPSVIQDETENQRYTQELKSLDDRYDDLPPEEKALADLLTLLVEDFEERHYALNASTPQSRLQTLMKEHNLRQRDLLHVFGSSGVASEVVNGKRAVSKAQARKLSQYFHVPAELFF